MKKADFCTILLSFALLVISITLITPISVLSAREKNISVITGFVASDFGMVANARVRISGSQKFSLTDKNGRFVIDRPPLFFEPITITEGKDGWFNNAVKVLPGSQNANIRLYPIPGKDNQAYRFISPAVCARCHNTLAKYWDK